MKKLLLLASALLLAWASQSLAADPQSFYQAYVDPAHANLTQRMYRLADGRANCVGSQFPVLVLALHGDQMQLVYPSEPDSALAMARLTALHEQGRCAVVAYPNGVLDDWSIDKIGGSWNARGPTAGIPPPPWAAIRWAETNNISDAPWLAQLITELAQTYGTVRTVVTGVSNGGDLAYRLGCQYASLVSSVAPVVSPNAGACRSPSSPVSILHVAGNADVYISPWNGGGLPGRYHPPHLPGISSWAAANGCSGTTVAIFQGQEYLGCSAVTRWHRLLEVGHEWPRGGAWDATQKILAFFRL